MAVVRLKEESKDDKEGLSCIENISPAMGKGCIQQKSSTDVDFKEDFKCMQRALSRGFLYLFLDVGQYCPRSPIDSK